MRKTTATILLLIVSFAFAEQPTTVFIVRHAEKASSSEEDPVLSAAGKVRAEELFRVVASANVTGLYATQYKRTQETVEPLSEKLALPITVVNASETHRLAADVLGKHAGRAVVIAAHSNSVPQIIRAFGGPELPEIPDPEYDNLYVLTVCAKGKASVLKLKFGEVSR